MGVFVKIKVRLNAGVLVYINLLIISVLPVCLLVCLFVAFFLSFFLCFFLCLFLSSSLFLHLSCLLSHCVVCALQVIVTNVEVAASHPEGRPTFFRLASLTSTTLISDNMIILRLFFLSSLKCSFKSNEPFDSVFLVFVCFHVVGLLVFLGDCVAS